MRGYSSTVWANLCVESIDCRSSLSHLEMVKWCSGTAPVPPSKNTVLMSVKKAGSLSIYPSRVCDRRREGIMIDLPSHNSPHSIINKLLKTYGGTEQRRPRRKALFCSLFVTVVFPRCLFGDIVTNLNSSEGVLRLLTHVWGGSNSSWKAIIHSSSSFLLHNFFTKVQLMEVFLCLSMLFEATELH